MEKVYSAFGEKFSLIDLEDALVEVWEKQTDGDVFTVYEADLNCCEIENVRERRFMVVKGAEDFDMKNFIEVGTISEIHTVLDAAINMAEVFKSVDFDEEKFANAEADLVLAVDDLQKAREI